jgi:hypothetical protein
MRLRLLAVVTAALGALAASIAVGAGSGAAAVNPLLGTKLISRALDGGIPNAPSTSPVISGDARFARVVAFQSAATNIVTGDTNPVEKVFAVKRGGSFDWMGEPWQPGQTILLSRSFNGQPANGPSFSPALDGNVHRSASCAAFLSAASNLVRHDRNGRVDAFVSHGPGGLPRLVSILPNGHQTKANVSAVALSGDCSRVAFVAGGHLYVRIGRRTVAIRSRGPASHPSFASGLGNDLVFAANGGVYLSRNGTGRPRLIAAGGFNPTFNGFGRREAAYEKSSGGHRQIFFRQLGHPAQLASANHGTPGDGDSRNPVVINGGFYVMFESDATNLFTNKASPDGNGRTDVYLYLDDQKTTFLESVDDTPNGHQLPGGGHSPDPNYYANYVVFDTPAPLGSTSGPDEVYMRYRGGV